jgi:hypothetical protein
MLTAVLALLVLGLAATPAGARTRDDAVTQANDFIDKCFRLGGNPEVGPSIDGAIQVNCRFSNRTVVCVWSAGLGWKLTCMNQVKPRVPVDDLPILEPTDPTYTPIAADDSYRASENRVLRRGAVNGVLANDGVGCSDSCPPTLVELSVRLVEGPAKGQLTLNPDGSFAYKPKRGFRGTDSFSYEASDGQGGTATATVTIKVGGRR